MQRCYERYAIEVFVIVCVLFNTLLTLDACYMVKDRSDPQLSISTTDYERFSRIFVIHLGELGLHSLLTNGPSPQY